MNTTIQQWHEQEFLPWKNAAESWKNKEQQFAQNVKQNAERLKYIVSLMLEKKETKAVQVWNSLNLGLNLAALRVAPTANKVEMQTQNGEVIELALDVLLQDIQRLIKA